MYACTSPVRSPSNCMRMGKIRGAMINRIAPIMELLMTFPNRRTESARVRLSSPMILNGSMKGVGRR